MFINENDDYPNNDNESEIKDDLGLERAKRGKRRTVERPQIS